MTILRLTVRDLELFPEPLDDTRYELIGGELHVSSQPSYDHQRICADITASLVVWSKQTGLGRTTIAPGVIFSPEDAVAPDVVWVARDREAEAVGPDRKLHSAPDLMVEVLSPGAKNVRRDRELKLDLYGRYGVRECWIVDWRQRAIDVFCPIATGPLELAASLHEGDTLDSPILPGFTLDLADFFSGID